VLIPPREHCWIESDAYDRSAFAGLLTDAPALADVATHGGELVPHFTALLEDVFCLLFKLDPRWRGADEVAPSAALNRALLSTLHDHPALAALRAETQLDETQAGLGTLLLGEFLLGLLRAEQIVPRGDLLDLWDLARQEDEVRSRARAVADVPADAPGRDELTHGARVAEAQMRQKTRNVTQRIAEMPARVRDALPRAAADLAPRIAETAAEARSWGTGVGAGGRTSAGRQIELGRRLIGNPKLRRLGALVGRMRQQALALRRRTFERSSEEVHAVETGRELEHLLPPELLALRHPLLRRDFARRLVEGNLLTYRLRGADERGRGPMVVCLDGSSSMAGEKELWAKAVALTLLELARRQRRLFRFMCFASGDTPLFTLDLNPRDHHQVRVDRTLDVAEYFPGGGTDFEMPLDAAADCLASARYRRGDVVLITDGECRVAPEWLERFRATKAKLGFSLFSVLIDVGSNADGTLRELSDRVTSVSRLTDDAARDLFLDIRR
jgi:uncharacterized protein with von Willebrand factor type A (vWA) domain